MLCLTPPADAAGGDCQEQDIVLRWLSAVTLSGHGYIPSLLRNSLSNYPLFLVTLCTRLSPQFLVDPVFNNGY